MARRVWKEEVPDRSLACMILGKVDADYGRHQYPGPHSDHCFLSRDCRNWNMGSSPSQEQRRRDHVSWKKYWIDHWNFYDDR